MKYAFFYQYPIGGICIAEEAGAISHVSFCKDESFRMDSFLSAYEILETPLIKRAATQLTEYFEGKRTEFDLPLAPKGTRFQVAVWKALQSIPAGETRSYKEIAAMIGNPQACRAVGMANNRNPIAIIIPCHRVIGQDGSLTGYAGGLPAKEYLLSLENPINSPKENSCCIS